MNTKAQRWILPFASVFLMAADLPPEYQAKFFKILLKSSELPMKVQCSDATLQDELKKAGIEIDANAKVAWGNNVSDIKKFKSAGLLVVCPTVELLKEGGSIAIVNEGGKPAIYLHKDNVQASGVKLGDSLFKIGKII